MSTYEQPKGPMNAVNLRRLVFRSKYFFAAMTITLFLAGIILIITGTTIFVAIGTSLVASTIVLFATLWLDHIRSQEQLLVEGIVDAGFSQLFSRRDIEDYDRYLPTAREIDVSGYTLRSFTESNEEQFRRRTASGEKFTVRMLLVDPRSSAAKIMEEDEKQPAGAYAQSFATICRKLQSVSSHVQIRTIDGHLPSMIYRIDNVVYFGPYLYGLPSRATYTFKFLNGGWLYKMHQDAFDRIWDGAHPIDLGK